MNSLRVSFLLFFNLVAASVVFGLQAGVTMERQMGRWPESSPDSDDPHSEKGRIALRHGDYAAAVKHYTISITRMSPTLTSFLNRAIAYSGMRQFNQALADCEAATTHNNHATSSQLPAIRLVRGEIYARMGEHSRAAKDFTFVISWTGTDRQPWSAPLVGRARCFIRERRFPEARRDLVRALKVSPQDADANVAMLYLCAGEGDSLATQHQLEKVFALADEPTATDMTCNSIAWTLATSQESSLRDGQRAVRYATKGCEATEWNNAPLIDTLAAAYAEAGDFANAVKWEEAYVARADVDEFSKQEGSARLELYRRSEPFRDPH